MLLMGKLTISMAMFNSYVANYQRTLMDIPLAHHGAMACRQLGRLCELCQLGTGHQDLRWEWIRNGNTMISWDFIMISWDLTVIF